MRKLLALMVLMLTLVAGCTCNSPDSSATAEPIVWVEKGITHEDVVIDLGYRDSGNGSVRRIEPVAKITRKGKPVANALVFSSLVSDRASNSAGEESATVYEHSPGSNAAHYTAGKLQLPDGTAQSVMRFRVVLPGSEKDWTRDVTVQLK